jgi:hypothetical protein
VAWWAPWQPTGQCAVHQPQRLVVSYPSCPGNHIGRSRGSSACRRSRAPRRQTCS